MAKFSQNTITQVAGFDGQCLASELVYDQKGFYNISVTTGTGSSIAPVNLTGVTLDASIIRRDISNLQDTRAGLSFDISDYTGGNVSPISLSVTNRNDTQGAYTVVFDDSVWSVMSSDPELNIDATDPVCFSGRIKMSYPVSGTQPEYDQIIFLLFLIRSDGVTN